MSERDSVVNAFLQAWLSDRSQGRKPTLEAYQERWPNFVDVIAEEFANLTSEEAAPNADLPHVAHFRLLEELGRGGQGVVYLADDTRMDRRVALKVLGTLAALDQPRLERFRREASLTARLNHPGICPVHETGQDDGCAWISMRYLDGTPLVRLIEEGRSTVSVAASLALRLARILQEAHAAGIVHRDIKPGNVMVTRIGDPVLLDFGLARDETSDALALTRTSHQPGTRPYMSPEQVTGQAPVDVRTDIWSLGVTLYEYLAKRRPFDATSEGELKHQIRLSAPPPLRKLNPAVPRPLDTIIRTALQKNPARRYATMGAFAQDLEAFLEDRPIKARPPSPLTRITLAARRHARISTAAAAILITALTVIILMTLRDSARIRTDLALQAHQALARAEQTVRNDPDPELALLDIIPAIPALAGDTAGLARVLDLAQLLADRLRFASAELVSRDVLDLHPSDHVAARAHLLIGRSRIAHRDPSGAAQRADLAAISGAGASMVKSLRAMASLLNHPIELPLADVRAATAFRFPRTTRDEIICALGPDQSGSVRLARWRMSDASPRFVKFRFKPAKTSPAFGQALRVVSGPDGIRLLAAVHVTKPYRSFLLETAITAETISDAVRILTNCHGGLHLITPINWNDDGVPDLALAAETTRKIVILDGASSQPISLSYVSGVNLDNDHPSLTFHDIDGDGTKDLLATVSGHRRFGISVLKKQSHAFHGLGPLTGLLVLTDGILVSKSFRPPRADVHTPDPEEAGIHLLLDSASKLGPRVWEPPELLAKDVRLLGLQLANGDVPILVSELRYPESHRTRLDRHRAAIAFVPLVNGVPEESTGFLMPIPSSVSSHLLLADIDGDGDSEILIFEKGRAVCLGLRSTGSQQLMPVSLDALEKALHVLALPGDRGTRTVEGIARRILRSLVSGGRAALAQEIVRKLHVAASPQMREVFLSALEEDLRLVVGGVRDGSTRGSLSGSTTPGFLEPRVRASILKRTNTSPQLVVQEDFTSGLGFFRRQGATERGRPLFLTDSMGNLGGNFGRGQSLLLHASQAAGTMSIHESEKFNTEPFAWDGSSPFRLQFELGLPSFDWGSSFWIGLQPPGKENERIAVCLSHRRNYQTRVGEVYSASISTNSRTTSHLNGPTPGLWYDVQLDWIPECHLLRLEVRQSDFWPSAPPWTRIFNPFRGSPAFSRWELLVGTDLSSSPVGSRHREVKAILDNVKLEIFPPR